MSVTDGMVLGLGESLREMFLRWNFRGPSFFHEGRDSDDVFYLIFVISAFFFVLLMAMMVVFAIRYRRVPGKVPQRSAGHNTWLELSWSVIPTILLVWMFFEGFWGYVDKAVAPAHAKELVLSAQKWNWTITYPNGAASPEVTRSRAMLTSPAGFEQMPTGGGGGTMRVEGVADVPIFVIPENYPIKLRMSSTDVIHSFWIPDFRVKFDVFPNRFTSMWFQSSGIDSALAQQNGWKLERTVFDEATRTKNRVPFNGPDGTQYLYNDHWAFCAEYCGESHSEMAAIIRVVPMAAYEQLIADWAEPTGTPVQIGEALYRIKGCNSCHSVDGSRGTGPTWKDIYGRAHEFADGTSMGESDMTGVGFANYIRESIYNPAAKLVKGYPNQMQSYQGRINERELEALIAYMKSLSAKAPKDEAPAAPAETGGAAPAPAAGDGGGGTQGGGQ